jgi:hypothetical protein
VATVPTAASLNWLFCGQNLQEETCRYEQNCTAKLIIMINVVQQQRAPLIMCCMLKPAMITTSMQATGFGNQTMYPYSIKDT